MGNCSENKNPLQRSGTNQLQRQLPGLQTGYILVDEKNFADWIVFANEFSRFLNFYDYTGSAAGDWKPFFSNDVSAVLGTIAIQDIEVYRHQIKERFDFLKDDDNSGDLPAVEQRLNELFSAVLSLSKSLDTYLLRLPELEKLNSDEKNTIALKSTLLNLVQTKLAPALKRLIAYYKAAESLGFLSPGNFNDWRILNVQVVSAESVINGIGLSEDWWVDPVASWSLYIAGITADESIFGPGAWTEYRRINHAANHNLFSSIFDQFLLVYTKIINEAQKELLKTLEEWDNHPPHYALFLSFLKLFKFAQAHINTITQKHLDFYYREVLHLFPKKAEPNSAHILIELAKQVDEYLLVEGTLMKAGKDSDGKEVSYALDSEETFNKAKIVSLKAMYKGDSTGKDDHPVTPGIPIPEVNNANRLFAANVINSDDGIGAELKSENKEWHPFVNKKFEEAELIDIAMPNAQIGFAVASHYLYLTEGQRKIRFRLATSNNAILVNKVFNCYLTTEKEWFSVPATAITPAVISSMTDTSACAEILITLGGDAPAITDYNQEVHGGTFNVTTPILKCYLKNDDTITTPYEYNSLKNLTVTKTEIKVEVGTDLGFNQKGLKQLLLSNDFGPVDPSKPFQPFGPNPAIGNRLVLGSKEVFTKKGATVLLNVEWKGLPASADIDFYNGQPGEGGWWPNIAIRSLNAGIWTNVISPVEVFGSATTTTPSSYISLTDSSIVPYSNEYTTYDISKSNGFIAIQLLQDFGHKAFLDAQIIYLINKANEVADANNPKPVEPYTPIMQSLYLSYYANTITAVNTNVETDFNNRAAQFFHIYPFGEAEQHRFISGNTNTYLFPQFNHIEESATVDHVGEFYIGIANLQGQQSVNVLFQMMEGTADPLLAKPEKHIHWSYLSKNQWIAFEDHEISDATRQLVQSGIISFIIPEEATTDNSILPTSHLWIRAALSEKAEAVCKLITVDAQAAVATFEPNDNADDFLDLALPAGTISKLKTPDSAVKKIIQPYSSFLGRAKETDKAFYLRVSERLRHKARAITIWDYEHLVLEAFPQIHKVKCLNHTRYDEIEYNEIKPGYVTVITIPNLINRNDTNPLRPYTNQNLLLDIEEYLKERISCHVKLNVRNPQFEEVRLFFYLRLAKGFDDFTFYSNRLKEEITQFLTPWAYDSSADIQFGGKIYKSVLIDFIEERPYVDYITEVQMFHKIDDVTPESGDKEEIVASTAKSILVSAKASKHVILELEPDEVEEKSECERISSTTHNSD